MVISVRDLRVSYGQVTVVDGVTFDAGAGEWLCLIGPNGAGKSTALRALAGLLSYQGEVTYEGGSIRGLSRREIARRVAFVPQNPLLPPGMSVHEYVLLGRTPFIGYLATEDASDLAIVADVLEHLDLAGLARRPLSTLSGGEQQRAVLGRALAQQARVLLLDEPTTALDVGKQQGVLELVDSLRADGDLTVVTAMHDLTAAGHFADRVVLLSGGRAVAAGPPRTVLTEGIISLHYGASVRVLDEPDGITVIPTRPRLGRGIAEGA